MKFSLKLHTALYLSIFFVSLHYVFVYLTNSSILKYFFGFSTKEIILIYGFASLFGAITLFRFYHLTDSVKKNLYIASIAEIVCLSIMYVSSEYGYKYVFLIAFFVHHFLTPFILYLLDILFESYTRVDERGKGRGFYSTMWNIPFIVVSILLSALSLEHSLNYTYIISLVLILPFIYFIKNHIQDVENKFKISYNDFKVRFKNFWNDTLNRKAIGIQLMLHLYYSITFILLPIYLHEFFGFNWDKIGLIFAVTMSPFVLIQIPFGNLEDKKHNENLIFKIGVFTVILFTILGYNVTTSGFMGMNAYISILLILFMTRVGCSLIEISTESLFYKHVNSREEFSILLFRMARLLPHSLGLLALFFI